MREVFKGFSDAWAFAVGKEGAAVRVCNGGWEVTWTGEKAAPEPLENFPGEAMMLRGFALADKKPAEILQRLKVRSVGMDADGEFYVCLNGLSDSFQSMYVRVTQADTRRFTVGSEIEVVLRPAPLA